MLRFQVGIIVLDFLVSGVRNCEFINASHKCSLQKTIYLVLETPTENKIKLTKEKALIASLPICLAALLPTRFVKGFLIGLILKNV
jgi:hypothetical protein